MRLRERDVARQVRDFLEAYGWRCFRWNVGLATNQQGTVTRYGEKGMADLMFLYYDYDAGHEGSALCLWVETKAEGKDLRPEQVTWQLKESKLGALIVTVDQFEKFRTWYRQQFEWLHRERGQLALPVES
jgi:hypothetical protein